MTVKITALLLLISFSLKDFSNELQNLQGQHISKGGGKTSQKFYRQKLGIRHITSLHYNSAT